MTNWRNALTIFLCVVVLAYFSSGFLARTVYARFHNPQLALAMDMNDAALAMDIGNYYFGGGTYDLPRAEAAYKKAVSISPHILWGHYQIARIEFVKADFAKALAEVNDELAGNPGNQRALYVRGLIYAYRNEPGDLALSEADFEKFILFAPTEWAGYNDLSWILLREHKFSDAKQYLLTALEKVPSGDQNPWLLNSLGLAYLNLGDMQNAKVAFLKAQASANALTEAEFHDAYPGDDPTTSTRGLAQFRAAIADNILKTEQKTP